LRNTAAGHGNISSTGSNDTGGVGDGVDEGEVRAGGELGGGGGEALGRQADEDGEGVEGIEQRVDAGKGASQVDKLQGGMPAGQEKEERRG
jgi:hypothetical protein